MVDDFTAMAEPTPAAHYPPYPPHGFVLPWNECVAAPTRLQFTNWHMKINSSLYCVGGDGRQSCVACQSISKIHSSTWVFSKPGLGQSFTSIYVPDFHWLPTFKAKTLENYGDYIQVTHQSTGSRAWLAFENFSPYARNKKKLQDMIICRAVRGVSRPYPAFHGHVPNRKGFSLYL